jgi:protein-disulfide isomerase
MNVQPASRPAWPMLAIGAALFALLGGAGGWFWQAHRPAAATPQRAEMERVVHDYLLNHPEVLPEAMEKLRQKEQAKQLAGVGDAVEVPFPGAILGNPNGTITLVEFSDFACTYCRRSIPDVEAVIAANPDLRVVMRELPILSPASGDAARMALAAAEQGKYAAFHRAMFAAGRPDAQTIEAAAVAAGLDLARARQTAADPRIAAELRRNVEYSRQLGLDGTPSWLIGEQMLFGAVGKDELTAAIAEERG